MKAVNPVPVEFECPGRSWSVVAKGREQSVTTGRIKESEIYRPLSGEESEERTVASRPKAAI